MVFCNVNFPSHLSSHTLDSYLEQGWFRMGQSIFTTSFLQFNNILYDAIWLRYDLNNILFSKSSKNILKKGEGFRVEINTLNITHTKEELFNKYRADLNFNISPSLRTLLFERNNFNVFNTYEICIYDGSKLIGLGIFDEGEKSAQGIINIYDPEYKKFSIGKLIVLQKLIYAIQHGFEYFYPGYFAPGYGAFDYKIDFLDAGIHYYDVVFQNWKSLSDLNFSYLPSKRMFDSLKALNTSFKRRGVDSNLYFYKYYDVKLFEEYARFELLTMPYFVHLGLVAYQKALLVTFNLQLNKYQVQICSHVFQILLPNEPNIYSSYFLRIEETIFENENILNVVKYLKSSDCPQLLPL